MMIYQISSIFKKLLQRLVEIFKEYNLTFIFDRDKM